MRVPTAVSGGVSMTTEEKLDWLQSLCAHDRKLIATPFSATVDGKRYIAATYGHLAVGLEVPGVMVREDGPDFASVWKPGVWVPADLGWIRNWAYRDRKIDRSECWSCDGEGYVKTTLIAFDKEGNGPFENLYEKAALASGPASSLACNSTENWSQRRSPGFHVSGLSGRSRLTSWSRCTSVATDGSRPSCR